MEKLEHSSFVPTTGYQTSTENTHQADQPLLESVHPFVDWPGSSADGPFQGVCAPVDRLVQAQGAFLMVVERIGARWVFDNSGTWADKSLETLAPTVLLISSRSASQTTASFARDMTRK